MNRSGKPRLVKKPPVYRLEDEKSLLHFAKNGDRTLSSLGFYFQSDYQCDKENLVKKASQILRKTKYCRNISIEKSFVTSANLLTRSIEIIRRLSNTRRLRLMCQNNSLEDRISKYSTLKPLKRLNRLESAQFNIFLSPIRRVLYTKFGGLIQVLRVKHLTIREPLTLASGRQMKRFYNSNKRIIKNIKSLSITNFTPYEGLIERYMPLRLVRRAINLRELHLNFVGISIDNRSLEALMNTIREIRYLNSLNLDLSFNKISSLNVLDQLTGVPLKHIHLNLSYCPLVEESFKKLGQFLKSNSKLSSVELIMNSIKISQIQIFELSEAFGTLTELKNVGISFSDIQSFDIRSLWKFFNHFLIHNSLTKANINLAQALSMGLPPEVKNIPLRSLSMKFLEVNINSSRIRNTEIAGVFEYFKYCPNIEELKLSLDSCKLNGKAGETISKWISSLKKLKGLEISMRFTDINEACISELLKGLSHTNLHELKLDFTDAIASEFLAESVWKSVLSVKHLKSIKIISSSVGMVIPSNYQDILKEVLPNCFKCEIL